MKKIWIALVVIAMLALLCTVGMITVFAEEGGQESCLHENAEGLYNNDEHWTTCPDCNETWSAPHVFELVALDNERHALACECGRVLSDSIDSHNWELAEGENHLFCAECGATTTACVYDQVTYYNDAYHTYGCICGRVDPNGLMEAHAVDMAKLQYNDAAHWYGCPCGYGAQDVADHVWGEAWVTDAAHHWKECVDCGAKGSLAEHSGGAATCQEAAACAECGASYEADTYTHVSDALAYKMNNTHHTALYACCGEVVVALERHNFVDSVCEACGYTCNHDVVISGATHTFVSTGNNTHIVVCRNCQLQEEKDCFGGEATCIAKAVCEDCKTVYGDLDPTNHVDLNTWATDLTHHWRVCTENNGCQQMVEGTKAEHDWNEGKCTTCEFECPHNEEDLEYVSNDAHTHDQVCTNCQLVMIDDQDHAWGEGELSGVCTICEYVCQHKESDEVTWMKWHNTDDYHKYICDKCGFEDTDKAGECAGGEATCMAKAVCETCNLEYGEKDPTNHVDTETWVTDADGHKKVCTTDGCGQEVAETAGAHNWENKDGVCDICKYECQVEPTGTSLDGLTHTVYCKTCGKVTVESEDHDWDETGKCTVCEYQCEHAEYEKIAIDADTHKELCVVCGYVKTASEAHDWNVVTGVCNGCEYECAHAGDDASWMKWTNEDGVHKFTCEKCHWEDVDKAGECAGGEATCMAKAVCDICGLEHGDIDPTNHVDTETWVTDADGHKKVCTTEGCGAEIPETSGAHDWTDANGICKVCQYECQVEPTGKANEDNETHKVSCDACGKVIAESEAHDWNSEGKCTVCPYECPHIKLSFDITIDSTGPESAMKWVSENAAHKFVCEICGWENAEMAGECAVGENGKEATCLTPAECGTCGNAYGEPDLTKHIWDAATGECTREGCDVVCDHAQVTVTDNGNDDNQHTTTCDTCGYVAAADCSGGNATCMVRALCDKCGASYGDKDPEEHDAELCVRRVEIIPGDTVNHNVYYTCKVDGEQQIPTTEEHNIDQTTHVCECGYGWHMAPVEGGSTSDSNMPYQGSDDLSVAAQQKSDFTAVIIVLSVIGLCAVSVTLVAVSKRKKNHN